jgi:single-strand DNA-binding protein
MRRSTVNDTFVTVAGVVASDPRAVVLDGSLRITSFRLASTSRRFDRATRDWVDGDTAWLTVTCWRALAGNAAESVAKRDRVIVHGRLRIKEWTSQDGLRRTTVEVVADSLGHDLSFGTSAFTRSRRAEPVELPGRAEAEELVRAVELDSYEDLADLLAEEPGERDGAAERDDAGEGDDDAALARPALAGISG